MLQHIRIPPVLKPTRVRKPMTHHKTIEILATERRLCSQPGYRQYLRLYSAQSEKNSASYSVRLWRHVWICGTMWAKYGPHSDPSCNILEEKQSETKCCDALQHHVGFSPTITINLTDMRLTSCRENR